MQSGFECMNWEFCELRFGAKPGSESVGEQKKT